MGAYLGRLQDYPKLARWYLGRIDSPPTSDDLVGHFIWMICRCLQQDDAAMVASWVSSLKEFANTSQSPCDDYRRAEEILAEAGLNISELATEVAETAVKKGTTDDLLNMMTRMADDSHLVVFRFLAAWIALNTDDLNRCVDECEKIDQPFASVYTIHGQALLELGRPKEAIEVLNVAVSISPNEILAWFQLAKAYHIEGDVEKSWNALELTRRLAPQSAEVAAFMAMIALQEPRDSDRLRKAGSILFPHLTEFAANEGLAVTALQLAMALQDQAQAAIIAETAHWDKFVLAPGFLKKLPPILRSLAQLEWNGVAASLLIKATIDMKKAS